MKEKRTLGINDNEKKQHFLQHKEKHRNNNEVYTDRLKSTEKKVCFASVFADIIRRGHCPMKPLSIQLK